MRANLLQPPAAAQLAADLPSSTPLDPLYFFCVTIGVVWRLLMILFLQMRDRRQSLVRLRRFVSAAFCGANCARCSRPESRASQRHLQFLLASRLICHALVLFILSLNGRASAQIARQYARASVSTKLSAADLRRRRRQRRSALKSARHAIWRLAGVFSRRV